MSVSAPEHTLLRSSENRFPNLVVVTGSQREFFEKKGADVLLASGRGSAGPCFIRLTVLSCQPFKGFPVFELCGGDNGKLGEFLEWVRLKKADGTVDRSAITGSSRKRLPTDSLVCFAKCAAMGPDGPGWGGSQRAKSGELRQTAS